MDEARDVLGGVRDYDCLRTLHHDPSVMFLKNGNCNWSERCGQGDFSIIYSACCIWILDSTLK